MRVFWTFLCLLVTCSFTVGTAHAGRLEAGRFTTTDTISGPRIPTPVTFQQNFDVPPIVVAISDSQGNNSASIRITNVTTTGFDALVVEPDNWDGRHVSQLIQYIAVEPGRHALPGGSIIEAGRTNTNAVQRGPGVSGTASFTNVSFGGPLSNTATVLAQIQTANSETRNVPSESSRPHITALAVNATSTGFQLALERSQASIGTVLTETVGWIAFPSGASDTFDDINGNSVAWGAGNSGNSIRGWDNGCFSVSLPITSGNVVAVAKKRTRNNGDGGWFRYCSLSASAFNLRVDEDRGIDNERSVAAGDAESAAIIAFSQPFHANLRANLQVTKTSFTISLPGDTGFSIPGATREYLITIQNSGNAPPNPDSLIITDALDPNTSMLVGDLGPAGIGPVIVTPGNGATGLTYSYSGLASTSDDLQFSDDGSSFAYIPTPGGDDEDSAVQAFRVTPSGILEGDRGSGPGELTLRYRVLVE
ncbi:MAG: H-type lectin domain-containing protein [Pseudomonadota bacterium]